MSFEENCATITSPSLTIVGAATQVFSWQIVRPVALNLLSQSKSPFFSEKQRICKVSCLGPLDAVMKTESLTSIGLDRPLQGNFVFHEYLLCGLNWEIEFVSAEPLP